MNPIINIYNFFDTSEIYYMCTLTGIGYERVVHDATRMIRTNTN